MNTILWGVTMTLSVVSSAGFVSLTVETNTRRECVFPGDTFSAVCNHGTTGTLSRLVKLQIFVDEALQFCSSLSNSEICDSTEPVLGRVSRVEIGENESRFSVITKNVNLSTVTCVVDVRNVVAETSATSQDTVSYPLCDNITCQCVGDRDCRVGPRNSDQQLLCSLGDWGMDADVAAEIAPPFGHSTMSWKWGDEFLDSNYTVDKKLSHILGDRLRYGKREIYTCEAVSRHFPRQKCKLEVTFLYPPTWIQLRVNVIEDPPTATLNCTFTNGNPAADTTEWVWRSLDGDLAEVVEEEIIDTSEDNVTIVKYIDLDKSGQWICRVRVEIEGLQYIIQSDPFSVSFETGPTSQPFVEPPWAPNSRTIILAVALALMLFVASTLLCYCIMDGRRQRYKRRLEKELPRNDANMGEVDGQYDELVQRHDEPVQRYNMPGQRHGEPVERYDEPVEQYDAPVQRYNETGQRHNEPVEPKEEPVEQDNELGQRYNKPGQRRDKSVQRHDIPVELQDEPVQRYSKPGQRYNDPGQRHDQQVKQYPAALLGEKRVLPGNSCLQTSLVKYTLEDISPQSRHVQEPIAISSKEVIPADEDCVDTIERFVDMDDRRPAKQITEMDETTKMGRKNPKLANPADVTTKTSLQSKNAENGRGGEMNYTRANEIEGSKGLRGVKEVQSKEVKMVQHKQPKNAQLKEPKKAKLKEPKKAQLKEPKKAQLKEPKKAQLQEVKLAQLKEPKLGQLQEVKKAQLKEPKNAATKTNIEYPIDTTPSINDEAPRSRYEEATDVTEINEQTRKGQNKKKHHRSKMNEKWPSDGRQPVLDTTASIGSMEHHRQRLADCGDNELHGVVVDVYNTADGRSNVEKFGELGVTRQHSPVDVSQDASLETRDANIETNERPSRNNKKQAIGMEAVPLKMDAILLRDMVDIHQDDQRRTDKEDVGDGPRHTKQSRDHHQIVSAHGAIHPDVAEGSMNVENETETYTAPKQETGMDTNNTAGLNGHSVEIRQFAHQHGDVNRRVDGNQACVAIDMELSGLAEQDRHNDEVVEYSVVGRKVSKPDYSDGSHEVRRERAISGDSVVGSELKSRGRVVGREVKPRGEVNKKEHRRREKLRAKNAKADMEEIGSSDRARNNGGQETNGATMATKWNTERGKEGKQLEENFGKADKKAKNKSKVKGESSKRNQKPDIPDVELNAVTSSANIQNQADVAMVTNSKIFAIKEKKSKKRDKKREDDCGAIKREPPKEKKDKKPNKKQFQIKKIDLSKNLLHMEDTDGVPYTPIEITDNTPDCLRDIKVQNPEPRPGHGNVIKTYLVGADVVRAPVPVPQLRGSHLSETNVNKAVLGSCDSEVGINENKEEHDKAIQKSIEEICDSIIRECDREETLQEDESIGDVEESINVHQEIYTWLQSRQQPEPDQARLSGSDPRQIRGKVETAALSGQVTPQLHPGNWDNGPSGRVRESDIASASGNSSRNFDNSEFVINYNSYYEPGIDDLSTRF